MPIIIWDLSVMSIGVGIGGGGPAGRGGGTHSSKFCDPNNYVLQLD